MTRSPIELSWTAKKDFFAPKRPNLARNWLFLSIAGSFGALLVGWLVVVARAVSHKTPIYFISNLSFLLITISCPGEVLLGAYTLDAVGGKYITLHPSPVTGGDPSFFNVKFDSIEDVRHRTALKRIHSDVTHIQTEDLKGQPWYRRECIIPAELIPRHRNKITNNSHQLLLRITSQPPFDKVLNFR